MPLFGPGLSLPLLAGDEGSGDCEEIPAALLFEERKAVGSIIGQCPLPFAAAAAAVGATADGCVGICSRVVVPFVQYSVATAASGVAAWVRNPRPPACLRFRSYRSL
jgi:hypothetical protein